ncbi:uncharacterized protein CDAR_403691 [Caerostris darwini]|uniref:Reverse transcriptase zinc-binding domain-containing protein n=1 Tax=Caerostris darwini TaxID=1538125 RepID=A0AAV4TFB8_9ARAC|nr:uncharacterized protein CDAR_403691 [Caerostris darwini]
MRTAQFPKGDWGKVDKVILKEVKNTLNLPTEASNNYVYGQRKLGCCGLPIATKDFDLISEDSDLCKEWATEGRFCFLFVIRLRTSRTTNLLRKKNQGKAIEVSSLAPASSHFLTDGAYTRFADWRFIHRARLNLVTLNGARPWVKDNDQRCRRCGYRQETLSHVLNHCSRYSHAWQLRHNSIVDRLVAALGRRGEILSCNQAVASSDLRPDIVFKKGSDIFLIDVTCPFENRKSAFAQARATKIAKYEPQILSFFWMIWVRYSLALLNIHVQNLNNI